MRDDTGPTLSVGEFVEYCQTQAGLLSGHVETMAEEADELLDEIDTMVADIRSKLEGHPNTQGTTGPSSTTEPGGEDVDISEAEELATTLEQKQAIVEAKQARMQRFRNSRRTTPNSRRTSSPQLMTHRRPSTASSSSKSMPTRRCTSTSARRSPKPPLQRARTTRQPLILHSRTKQLQTQPT